MDSKDELAASKMLIDFIRDSNLLIESQLESIRQVMQETVEDVMETINAINTTADERKSMADEVLVKSDSGEGKSLDGFTKISSKEIENQVEANKKEVPIERLDNALRRLGGQFSKHMEVMTTMDSQLQMKLFNLVGALSVDDVLGQRVNHQVSSIKILKDSITEVVDKKVPMSTKAIEKHIASTREEFLAVYTTEDERKTYREIFKPDAKRSA